MTSSVSQINILSFTPSIRNPRSPQFSIKNPNSLSFTNPNSPTFLKLNTRRYGEFVSLGCFRVNGIPPASRGDPQFEVEFDIDADGILNFKVDGIEKRGGIDTKTQTESDGGSSWYNHIDNCIDSYLHSQIGVGSSMLSDSDDSILSDILSESINRRIKTITNESNLTKRESPDSLDRSQKYRHLWVQCENCFGLNYKKLLKSKKNICEQCGYHLKMTSSDRIELLIDQGTWNPMNEDMVSTDPIEFISEEESYKDRVDSYQRQTGLTDAVQTGVGQLNGIPVAIGVMDFQFMGGSMGSVVGEKITRLIEYASENLLPLIIVCASGGARMQEGSLSLMQMAKISSALYDYQSNKKLFYVPVLTSPTTGGVTASFAMLGDIIIAEPNAHIAFAGKRVIEQTLKKTVPEGTQAAEHLFQKGLIDIIVPRNLLKDVLAELFQLHAFLPVNQVEH